MASQGNVNASHPAVGVASGAYLLSVIVGVTCALFGFSRYPFVLVSFLSLLLVRDFKPKKSFFYAQAVPSIIFMMQATSSSADFTGFSENIASGHDFSFYLSSHEYFSYIYLTVLSFVSSGELTSILLSFVTSSIIAFSMLLALRSIGLRSIAILAAMSAIDYSFVIHLLRQSIGLSILFLALSIVVGNMEYKRGMTAINLFRDSYRHLETRKKTSVIILLIIGAFTHQVCMLFVLTIALSFLVPSIFAWLTAASVYIMYVRNDLPSSSAYDSILRDLYSQNVGKLDVYFIYANESYSTLQPFARIAYVAAILIPIIMTFMRPSSDSSRLSYLNTIFLLSMAITLPLSPIAVIGPRFGLVSNSLMVGVPLVSICMLLRRSLQASTKTGCQYTLRSLLE